MNVVAALNLRKPDKRFESVGRTGSSDKYNTRFNKKNNIKDILVRNFFRKYPIGIEVSDMEQIRIEKDAALQFEEFVIKTGEINSKNLDTFEKQVANSLKLIRAATNHSLVPRTHNMTSPANRQHGALPVGNNIHAQV
jgi:hypothetical protein